MGIGFYDIRLPNKPVVFGLKPIAIFLQLHKEDLIVFIRKNGVKGLEAIEGIFFERVEAWGIIRDLRLEGNPGGKVPFGGECLKGRLQLFTEVFEFGLIPGFLFHNDLRFLLFKFFNAALEGGVIGMGGFACSQEKGEQSDGGNEVLIHGFRSIR